MGESASCDRGEETMTRIRACKSPSLSRTCIYDNARECFVWVSQRAATEEKRLGLEYAHVSHQASLEPVSMTTHGSVSCG